MRGRGKHKVLLVKYISIDSLKIKTEKIVKRVCENNGKIKLKEIERFFRILIIVK